VNPAKGQGIGEVGPRIVQNGSKQAEKYAADRMLPDALATGTDVGFADIGQR
jgi:hypothetical protein